MQILKQLNDTFYKPKRIKLLTWLWIFPGFYGKNFIDVEVKVVLK